MRAYNSIEVPDPSQCQTIDGDDATYRVAEPAQASAALPLLFDQAARDAPIDDARGALREVPAHPLHLCPDCGYNLTGLISRRCPECGQPFFLTEARRAGGYLTAADREDYAAERSKLLFAAAGGVMLAVGYFSPLVAWFTNTHVLEVLVWTVIVASIFGGAVFLITRTERRWYLALFLVGAVVFLMGICATWQPHD